MPEIPATTHPVRSPVSLSAIRPAMSPSTIQAMMLMSFPAD